MSILSSLRKGQKVGGIRNRGKSSEEYVIIHRHTDNRGRDAGYTETRHHPECGSIGKGYRNINDVLKSTADVDFTNRYFDEDIDDLSVMLYVQ